MFPTPSAHRLRRGLPGYLILFATHAFAPQRQCRPRDLPSPLVFLLISAHSTATQEFQSPLPNSSLPVSKAGLELSSRFSLPTRQTAYEPFTPNKSGQRLHPTYYRGCWHVVSRCFFCRYRHFRFVPAERGLQPKGLRSLTRRCCVRLSSIAQYSPLLPPVGVWAVSQSQCGRSPSQAGYPSSPW